MKKKLVALVLGCMMALGLLAGCAASPSKSGGAASGDLNVGVFYYSFADVYISTVRSAMDTKLDELGAVYKNYDGNSNQTTQTEQVQTAITDGANLLIVNIVETSSPDAAQAVVDAAKGAGIPIIFFNREVDSEVVKSYEKCAFVGTDAAEAGHMQGEMIGKYLMENYDAVDLNGDGEISYVMFKGQEGNAEAEYRTQFAVEDADKVLEDGGKSPLKFYDDKNSAKYLVDQNGNWSAQASNEYLSTILSEYSESNKNMVELVIANNDGMAEGAITALQAAGYNTGEKDGKVIPVFGVDAVDSAKQLIQEGKMAGTIKQDSEGMAATIVTLITNVKNGEDLMANTSSFNVDEDVAKIRVPYGIYTGE